MAQTTLDKFYKVTSKKSVNVKNNVNVEKASSFRSPISSRKEGQGKKLTAKRLKGLRNDKLFKAFIRQLAENILFSVGGESNSSNMDINKSPTKVVETATSTSPSTKYVSPVRSQQRTPITHNSGSKFSPKTSSPIKEAFEKSQRKEKARRRLFNATEELVSKAVDNLNLAREGAIANNDINLEKVYASRKFDYQYKRINTAASTRYEVDDVVVPKDTYSLHFFLAVATVFSKPVNCGYFDQDELNYIFSLLTLSKDAQALFIRMLKRKHTWHRISSIKYDEVSKDLRPIFDELVSRSIFKSSMKEENLSILLNLLQVDEIRKLCQESKISSGGGKKDDYVQSILKLSKKKPLFPGMQSPAAKLRASVNKRLGGCVMLNGRVKEMVDKIITLLIPNRDPAETLSDVFHTILRVDTSEIKFPQVKISDLPIFASKQHLLDYVEAKNALFDVLNAIEKKQWQTVRDRGSLAAERLPFILEVETLSLKDSTLPHHIRHFMPGYTWLKVLHKSIDAFKKSKALPTAIEYLRMLIHQDCHMKHRKGQWYAELIKIEMYHMKNLDASVELLADAVAYEDLTEVDKLDLLERAEMLAKRKTGIDQSMKNVAADIVDALSKTPLISLTNSVTIQGTLCGNTSSGKSSWLISNSIDESTYGSVENFALHYYRNEGYIKGVHCEGALPVTLFGTLFWKEIYDVDVPGAYVSLYQDAPLDLYSSEFYANRKDRIDMKLQDIRDFDVETLSSHFKHKFDTYCEYRSISVSQGTPFENSCTLQEIVLCLGVEGIVRICERLLHNYTLWRAGFPDLIVWNVHTKQYKIVEVKGPGDSLSTKQKLWLTYLNQLGFNTEVCYCESGHSNGRKRKREETM